MVQINHSMRSRLSFQRQGYGEPTEISAVNAAASGADDTVEETLQPLDLSEREPSAPYFARGGVLRPFRLLKGDLYNLRTRYASDWAVFNQQVIASSIYIFFTNILPGITFASDLYVLTGKSWGTIEVVFSTGLCGTLFAV